jgi:four helix bundle protein
LEVWKASRKINLKIYGLSERISKDFGLQNQIRKAVISISSNTAEGFERDGKKRFIQSLAIAKGSVGEVRSQLYLLLDLKYITEDEFSETNQDLISIGKMINGLINYLKSSDLKGNKYK